MSVIIDFLKKFEVYSTLIVAFLIYIQSISSPPLEMTVGVDFEVYGRVQGVFFRKYTEARATELGLKGWCMNTKQGTVLGYIEGERNKVEEMKTWLQRTGSPQSAIDKAEFRNEKILDGTTLEKFSIKKSS
ncbi:acylphosphatase-1 [Nasonia vitripennis]|uniref:Acylphosphatase n=1 Tax=Nasonia vitripennis TaxID=7425 RepID=A0A7M7G8Q4_NASVI|nr:acylphosphatase-1 [Nasonia vitripennis]